MATSRANAKIKIQSVTNGFSWDFGKERYIELKISKLQKWTFRNTHTHTQGDVRWTAFSFASLSPCPGGILHGAIIDRHGINIPFSTAKNGFDKEKIQLSLFLVTVLRCNVRREHRRCMQREAVTFCALRKRQKALKAANGTQRGVALMSDKLTKQHTPHTSEACTNNQT